MNIGPQEAYLEALQGGGTTGGLVGKHTTDRAPEHTRRSTVVHGALLGVGGRALVQELQELDFVAHVYRAERGNGRACQHCCWSTGFQFTPIACFDGMTHRHVCPKRSRRGVSARSDFCMFQESGLGVRLPSLWSNTLAARVGCCSPRLITQARRGQIRMPPFQHAHTQTCRPTRNHSLTRIQNQTQGHTKEGKSPTGCVSFHAQKRIATLSTRTETLPVHSGQHDPPWGRRASIDHV